MALFRNLINKINYLSKCKTIINTNKVFNYQLSSIQRFYSTAPTPYEIVDIKKIENEAKGKTIQKFII